ncbi:MAG: type II secretion system F family protein [bacterium]|nr:type II secretion system F family protein [bacterium]
MVNETLQTTRETQNRYHFVARGPDGKRHRGLIEAANARGAKTALMERGLEPIRVQARRGLPFLAPKVSQTELMHFSRQLAVFVRAGIPILEAIDGLAESTSHATMKRTLTDVGEALRTGQTLSEAFDEHPKVFPTVYRGAVMASERTGNLDASLDRLATYLERAVESRRKLVSALTYPAIVIALAIVVVVVLSVFVIPRFEGLFATLGGELPLATRILVVAMDFLTAWGVVLAVGATLLLLGGAASLRTIRGRRWLDSFVLRLPVIGDLVSTAIIERFFFALGSMVEAAVTLPDALEIAGEGTNNDTFQWWVAHAREQMLQGEGIANPLAETGLFPMPAVQMIRAGERAGTLERQLITAAEFYGKELDFKLARYIALFEPAIIVAAGLMVGFVAIALVSAIYGLIGTTGL